MLPRGIRRLFRLELNPRRVTAAIDDELHFHFDMAAAHYMSQGMSESDARREAERRFGDVARTRARMETIDRSRAERAQRTEFFGNLGQDLRYAARGLRSSPAFTAVVVLMLALGVGANATMFGVIDRLLLRSPAYLADPARTNVVYLGQQFDGVDNLYPQMSYARYVDLTQWTKSFSQTAGYFYYDMAVGTGDDAAERKVGMVSASYWRFFDAKPVIGRFFTADEDRIPAGSTVAVLGYSYWQSRYAGRTDVLGKTIALGTKTYTIVGVAPVNFTGIDPLGAVAFIPITTAARDIFAGTVSGKEPWYATQHLTWMRMLVRRKPGVSEDAASADLTNAFRRSYLAQSDARPVAIARPHAVAEPVLSERGPNKTQSAKVATWLVGVTLIVLLIACANVANLLLARAFRRRREIAVRMALGVSRGRLLLQLLTESVLLAVLGGIAGLLVAQWGGSILRVAVLPDVEWTSVLADSRTLVFTGVTALLIGVLTGLAPAVFARRTDVSAALKSSAREGTYHGSRLRTTLLVMQGALSILLVVGAGLFVRSLRNVREMDFGYDAPHVLFVAVEMRGVHLDSAANVSLRRQLVAQAANVPGVENATQTVAVPFWMSWSDNLFTQSRDSIHGDYLYNTVSPSYFATMGTRIVRGRGFTSADGPGAPKVLVVSQTMAKALWPHANAIGQCLRQGADTTPCATVVGIAEDIVSKDITNDPHLFYYAPVDQTGGAGQGLFVRTRGDATSMAAVVRRELQRLMPGIAYVAVTPLETILEPNVRPWRLGATMFALFGALALLLAAIGLYSVITYDVTQRRHELGVRIALGAGTGDVVRLVLGSGLRVALGGVAIGGAIGLTSARFIAPLLYRVSPKDPLIYATAAGTLLSVAILASVLPAWRASRVDPNVVLRTD